MAGGYIEDLSKCTKFGRVYYYNFLISKRKKEMNETKKIGIICLLLCFSLLGAPYTDNGNGTVTDSATGLIWQKCSAGQGTTLGNCSSGSSTYVNWSGAITYCEGLTLGGRSDWRLPNFNELISIIDYTKTSNPFIDTTAFPNIQFPVYWSSSTYTLTTSKAWLISYSNGLWYNQDKVESLLPVRCVTGQ